MPNSKVLAARSQLGNAVRAKDTKAELEARRDLAAAKIEKYITQTTADAPQLTEEQRTRLAHLIAGGAA